MYQAKLPCLGRGRPQTPRLIIRPRLGPSGGRMQFAPTPEYNYSAYMYPEKFAAPAGAECNSPLPGYNHSTYM